jgi:hypothetical protein
MVFAAVAAPGSWWASRRRCQLCRSPRRRSARSPGPQACIGRLGPGLANSKVMTSMSQSRPARARVSSPGLGRLAGSAPEGRRETPGQSAAIPPSDDGSHVVLIGPNGTPMPGIPACGAYSSRQVFRSPEIANSLPQRIRHPPRWSAESSSAHPRRADPSRSCWRVCRPASIVLRVAPPCWKATPGTIGMQKKKPDPVVAA